MPLKIINSEGFCTVILKGDLTIFEMSDYHKQLIDGCQGMKEVTLDLSETDDLDTAGIQLLLSLDKQLSAIGGDLILMGQGRPFSNILDTFGLSDHFKSAKGGN